MYARYPATYRDAHGEEHAVIENDGKMLRVQLRGVEFEGSSFDWLTVSHPDTAADLASFTLNHGELCNCIIECDMPLTVVFGVEEIVGALHIRLELGSPRQNGSIDCDELCMTLRVGTWSYTTSTRAGWFEDQLVELARALPDDIYMKNCFGCAYSDYCVAGNAMFGAMACFRGNKAAYLATKGKYDLMQIWDTRTEWVQETFVCSDFSPRVPGTGYRG